MARHRIPLLPGGYSGERPGGYTVNWSASHLESTVKSVEKCRFLIGLDFIDRFYTTNIRLSTEGVCTTNGTGSFVILGGFEYETIYLGI